MKILWRALYPIVLYELVTAALFLLRPDGEALLSQGISAVLTAAVLFPVYARGYGGTLTEKDGRRRLRRLTFGGIGGRQFLWLVVAGAAASICFNCVIDLSGLKAVFTGYEQTAGLVYVPSVRQQVLWAGVLIPLTEELIFRGFIYDALRRFSFPAAAFVSAGLFGFYHGSIIQGGYAFMIGLVLADCRENVGCLGAAVLVHVSANLTSLAVEAAAGDAIASAWVQAVLAAAGALALWRSLKRLVLEEKKEV